MTRQLFSDYVFNAVINLEAYSAHPYHWFNGDGKIYGKSFKLVFKKKKQVELWRLYDNSYHQVPLSLEEKTKLWPLQAYIPDIQYENQESAKRAKKAREDKLRYV